LFFCPPKFSCGQWAGRLIGWRINHYRKLKTTAYFFARNIVGKIFQDENENDIVTNKSNHKTIKPVFQLWRTSIISKTIEPTELSALPGNTHAQFWRLAPVPLRSPAARGTGTSLRRDFKQWGRYENVLSTLIKHLHCTPLISINNKCCR